VLHQVARALAESDGVGPTVDEVVAHALLLVPCDWAVAAVTQQVGDRPPRFYATSDPELLDLVASIAMAAPSSPGREALTERTVVHVPDLGDEPRFGSYPGEMLARTPIRSVLSLVLQLSDEVLGVLTLYGSRPHAFDESAVARARQLADYAAIAIDAGLVHDHAGNLQAALRSSRVIGMAMGVLLERHRLSPEQAFERLRALSQDSNRKLADIAEELTRTGEVPSAGSRAERLAP
jgi:GAF domain-containing protein